MPIANGLVVAHPFLEDMYADPYFPKPQVDKVREILVGLCERIEEEKPSAVDHFLRLTHEATGRVNGLAKDFEDNGSELETGAREAIAADFGFIARAYGFADVDVEHLIAPRDW